MNLVDLKALSHQIPISVFTLRKFVKVGMPHYRVGRKILVDPREFEEWLQQFKSGSHQNHGDLDQMLDQALLKYK